MADGCEPQGIPPATLAEFTLGINGNADYYDVSVVDGSNLPMTVTSDKGCPTASCPVDLNPSCKLNISFKNISLMRGSYRPIRTGLQGLKWYSRGM